MENALEELPIVERDPWLRTYESALRSRYDLYRRRRDEIGQGGDSLRDYANGYLYYGFQYDPALKGWHFREWLPGPRTSTCSATSTAGSARNCGCARIPTASGAFSCPTRVSATGSCTARWSKCSCTAPTAGWNAYRPISGASFRTPCRKTSRGSCGSARSVRLAGRRFRHRFGGRPADLRMPCGHGAGGASA